MPQEFSFDVVSKVDLQAVEDAVNTANKEIATRFDFKGSCARLDLDKKASEVTLLAEDDGKLRSVRDVFQTRLIKRGVPLKNLNYKAEENAENGTRRQSVSVLQGLSSDKTRQMTATIKKAGLKVTATIQGDQVRVVSRSKDELQAVIGFLKNQDFGQELQFVNYR